MMMMMMVVVMMVMVRMMMVRVMIIIICQEGFPNELTLNTSCIYNQDRKAKYAELCPNDRDISCLKWKAM